MCYILEGNKCKYISAGLWALYGLIIGNTLERV